MAHTASTIATMARLARAAQQTYPIRNLATRITAHVPSKQIRGELAALYRWVRDTIRYRFDPLGIEWVQAPDRTVLEASGDCDDMATLLAALAGSLGHEWRFSTVGPGKNVMKHVLVEVFDGKGWVPLDPVLEPPATTTAPRDELGAFGRLAPARARRIWNAEGIMLSGLAGAAGNRGMAMWEGQLGNCRCFHVETPRTMARKRAARKAGLSGAVDEGGRELWSFAAYYPSNPTNWIGAGIAPTPVAAYRSTGVAGPIVFTVPSDNELKEGLGYIGGLGDLGFGFLKKIGKAVSGAVKVVGKIPGVNLVTKAAASIIPGGSLVLDAAKSIGGKILGGGGKGGPAPAPGAPAPAEGAAPGGLTPVTPIPSAPGAPAPGCTPLPNLASRGDISDLRQEIATAAKYCTKSDLAPLMLAIQDRNNKVCAANLAKQRNANAAQLKAAKASALKAQAKAVATAKALVQKTAAKQLAKAAAKAQKKAKRQSAAIKKLKKRVAAFKAGKYPKGSTQVFNPSTNTWTVLAPKTAVAAGVSGLGFSFRPSLSFSLAGAADTAPKALAAIVAFIKKNKQSPQIAFKELKAFQSDVGLKADGVYGPNARAALAWALHRSDLPPVAAPYAKAKITWRPPAAPVAAAVPKGAVPIAKAVKVAKAPKAPKPKKVKAPKPAKVAAPAPALAPVAASSALLPAGPGIVDSRGIEELERVQTQTEQQTDALQRRLDMLPTAGAESIARPVPVKQAIAQSAVPGGYVAIDRTSSDPKLPPVMIDVSGPRIVPAKKKKAKKGAKRKRPHAKRHHRGKGVARAFLWAALGYFVASRTHRRSMAA